MKKIRNTDIYHIAAGCFNGLIYVIIPLRDMMLFSKGFCFVTVSCIHGNDFSVGYKTMITFHVNITDKAGAQQGNFDFLHRSEKLDKISMRLSFSLVTYRLFPVRC